MTRRAGVFAACSVVAAAVALSAAQELTRRDADLLEQKWSVVVARGATKPSAKVVPSRTSFSERELNAYLKFNAHDQLPKGVLDPQVSLVGDRRVSGRAIVDLDAVRSSKERGWFDPAAYLSGTVEVHMAGELQTANGKGTFQLESATVGSLPIPKSLLQELVTYYSRSADLPGGFEIDKPFDLPASILEVQIQRGAATVIQ